MESINKYKLELINKYVSLPDERKVELRDFYGKTHDVMVQNTIIKEAKESAQYVINYADRKGYGYGEVGFNLNENVADFAEDAPELEKEYKLLQRAYFNFLIESKNI